MQERCLNTFKEIYGDFNKDFTKPMIVHIANETSKKTSFAYHNKMKAQGKVAGIPDLMIIGKGKLFFVELKAEDGKTSKEQDYFIKCLNYNEHNCFICKTQEDFMQVCKINL